MRHSPTQPRDMMQEILTPEQEILTSEHSSTIDMFPQEEEGEEEEEEQSESVLSSLQVMKTHSINREISVIMDVQPSVPHLVRNGSWGYGERT